VTFTFFNAMAMVLILSIGVDYSVFCAETSGARKPVTALAIALAALSTILSFGMLAFSRVFAVHAFGVTMLIGISLAFLFAPAAGDATAGKARA
jgi:predicted exporter